MKFSILFVAAVGSLLAKLAIADVANPVQQHTYDLTTTIRNSTCALKLGVDSISPNGVLALDWGKVSQDELTSGRARFEMDVGIDGCTDILDDDQIMLSVVAADMAAVSNGAIEDEHTHSLLEVYSGDERVSIDGSSSVSLASLSNSKQGWSSTSKLAFVVREPSSGKKDLKPGIAQWSLIFMISYI